MALIQTSQNETFHGLHCNPQCDHCSGTHGIGGYCNEHLPEVVLTMSMKVTIGGNDFFKTSCFGLPSVLFSYPDGEVVGAYNESSGEIQEIEFVE